jgi:hypothetical protein
VSRMSLRALGTRRGQLLAGAAASAVIAATLVQTVTGGGNKVQIGTGSVSTLKRQSRAADALPPNVLRLPFAVDNFATVSGAGARLIKTDGSTQIFVVPGKRNLLCVIEVDPAAQTSGGACADRKILLTGSIWTAEVRDDGTKDVVGIVGDGHTYAEAGGRRVPVENNAFVLHGVDVNDLTIGSPTAQQTLQIGG